MWEFGMKTVATVCLKNMVLGGQVTNSEVTALNRAEDEKDEDWETALEHFIESTGLGGTTGRDELKMTLPGWLGGSVG